MTLDKAVPSVWEKKHRRKRTELQPGWRKRKSAPGADILLYTDG